MINIPNALEFRGHLTGGQPEPAHFPEFSRAGYKTMVDLRPANEAGAGGNEENARAAGLEFVRIAISSEDDLTEENARKLDEALARGPAVVTCASGNRVGALFAIREAKILGKSYEEALEVGDATGLTRLRSAVEVIIDD